LLVCANVKDVDFGWTDVILKKVSVMNVNGNNLMNRPKCAVIIGKIGSGKSTISDLVAHRLGWTFFEVSSVVRDLTGRNRDTIRHNKLTGKMVASEVVKRLDKNKNYVISGPRQYHIVVALSKYFKVRVIQLNVPISVRLKRVRIHRGEKITLDELNQQDQLDYDLGLNNLWNNANIQVDGDNCLSCNVRVITQIIQKEL
jgi:shikimate kinase